MDWRKLTFSHHFSNALPRGRKVISGFGIGAGASLVLLILIWFSPSVKSPFGKPIFQGYPSFSRNSSIISWPFSLPTTSLPSSSSSSSSGFSNATASASSDPVNKTHVVNVSQTAKSGKLLDSGAVLEKPHGLNTSDSENTRKGFSKWKIGRIPEEGFPQEGKNVSVSANETMAGRDLNKTSMEKSAGSIGNSTVGNIRASGNKRVGNLSSTVGHLMPPNKQERTSKAHGRRNIPKKDNFIPLHSQIAKGGQGSLFGGCDIFDGRWVRDDSSDPYYPAGSCPYIDRDFDCHFNGRPDDGYVRWKWKPLGCDIPSLNGTDFLERLRGKKLVFVGDSLNRNMWESLVCILRSNIQNKEKVYEISGNTNFKKKGVYAFRFEDYNCSVDFVSSPFLVRESYFNGKNGSFETLRLDLMDGTTSMYHDADVVVFNTGHWWTHEKTSRGEDYYQEGSYVHPRLKVLSAYQKALTTWATWVDRNINRNRTQVFFRGFSVTHFRGGQWNSGGQCHKETEPISNDTFLANYPSKMRTLEHVLRAMRTPITYMNISRLTDYRKDAHPSIYRKKYETAKERHAAEQSQDCSHWCLPGVPDTWNQLLYVSLLNSGRGSWKH